MPLGGRGERIGDAFIRIHASGEDIGPEMKNNFRDQDGLIEAEGNRHSKMYVKAWEDGLKNQTSRTKLQRSLARGLADADLLEHFLKGKGWRDFRAGIERQYGVVGRRAAASLEQGLASGMSHDELRAQLEDMTRLIDQTDRDYHRDRESAWREHHARIGRQAAEVFATLQREIPQLRVGDRRAMSKGELRRDLRELAQDMERAGVATKDSRDRIADFDIELRRTHPTLGRFISGIDLFADRSGRAFGKGSRSEFLNFIGSLAAGMTRTLSLPVRLARSIANIGPAVAEAGGGLSGFLKVAARGSASAAAGLGAFLLVLGPLISMLSLAAGAVLALASSLTMALIGALGAVGGALLPGALGIGVAIAGFMNLEGAAKRAASGIGDAFKDLGKSAAGGLTADQGGFIRNMEGFQDLIRTLNPLVREIGQAINLAFGDFNRIIGGANGPLDQFIRAVTAGGDEIGWMGQQVRKLGDFFSNSFGGLLGMFRGLMPTIDRFTTWLQDIGREFNEWANSVRGQQSIRRFFEDAADSARDFGSFLSGVWTLLGSVITLGNEAGDSMFRSLGDKARELAAYLNTPQGAAAFREWMNDAREFAEALGTLVVAVSEFIAVIDNDITRALAKFSVAAMTAPFRAMAGSIDYVMALLRNFAGVAADVLDMAKWIPGAKGLANSLRDFANGAQSASQQARGWGQSAERASAGVAILTTNVKGIPKRIETVFEQRGLPESMKGLQRLFRQQKLTPKEIRTTIKALGAEKAWADFRRTQRESDKTDGKRANPKVNLKTLEFDKAMKATLRELLELDRDKATPKADINPTQFNAGVAAARRLLRDVGNDVARPRIEVTSNAAAVAAGTRAILGSIQDEVVNIFTRRSGGKTASGGMFRFEQQRTIAEAGPEAVVPLNRPLAQVDPAVRWLSAIAQGKYPGMERGGVVGAGKTMNIHEGAITVISPQSDPRAVAVETVNHLVNTGY